jgi:hypothetical protein
VYRLIGILPQCAACHGPKDAMSTELLAVLEKRYPKDEATGYANGQWRGLIRVTVAETPGKSPAAPKKKR